jgi:deoxyribose-phosphate aldolase
MQTDFGRYIDHTLLQPTGTSGDIRRLCTEAMEYGMAAICIFPYYVTLAREILRNSRVSIATVIAFPFGVALTDVKEAEIRSAATQGAGEMDIVINISAVKSGDLDSVETEMHRLVGRSRSLGVATKFIIETAYLTNDEKIALCKIANRVRPDFMKTSTGYGPAGATIEDVRLMRSNLNPEIQIKAAGGIRSYGDAREMLRSGASRLGTSSSVRIIQESDRNR